MKNNLVKIEKIVIILLSILIVISLVFKFNNRETKEKIQIAPGVYLDEGEENIIDTQTIDGIKFDVTGYIYDPNVGGQLTVRMTNTKNKVRTLKGLKVKLLDSKENEITNLDSTFYVELGKDESYEFIYNVDESLAQEFVPKYTIIE